MVRSKDLPEMWLRPVGIVRNEIKEPSLVAESHDLKWQAEDRGGKKEG